TEKKPLKNTKPADTYGPAMRSAVQSYLHRQMCRKLFSSATKRFRFWLTAPSRWNAYHHPWTQIMEA
ncbi:MAG: hypothetical protein MI717_12590, partial [Spirochaetales bacterium]|nr:hypothetical protein [Spirochaetales bacterium]